jgi:hypothetical protein
MPTVSFTGLLVIAVLSVAVPLLGALLPRLPIPGIVGMALQGRSARALGVDLNGGLVEP